MHGKREAKKGQFNRMKTAVSRKVRLFAAARRILSGTLLSRLAGLFREVALAASFGASPEIASFMVAFRLANFFRRFIGESGLAVAFIPHFASLKEKSPAAAAHFFTRLSLSLKLLLLALAGTISGAFYFAAPFLPSSWQEVFSLTSLLSFSLFFIGLYALNQAFLQTCGRFFVGAAAPVAFNLVFTTGALIAHTQNLWPPTYFLAVMAVLGFAAQWIVTMPSTNRAHVALGRDSLADAELPGKSIAKATLLTLIGLAAQQVNMVIDGIFAKLADPSAPAYLWYALRVYQLPLSLVALSFAGALLPTLSKGVDDPTEFSETLRAVFDRLLLWMIPITGALFVLAPTGLGLLYGHGHFDVASLVQTTYCLWGYGLGLVANCAVLILVQAFYARKDFKTPSWIVLFVVGLNATLNALFLHLGLGAFGIAFATAISAVVNALALRLKLKDCTLISKGHLGKIFFATVLSCAVVTLWSIGRRDFSSKVLLGLTAGLEMPPFTLQLKALFSKSVLFAIPIAFLGRSQSK